MIYQPKHRAETDADRAVIAFRKMMDEASERNKVRFREFEKPYCQGFSDLMDGFVIHAPQCPLYQDMAISSSVQCIGYRHVDYWPEGLSSVR